MSERKIIICSLCKQEGKHSAFGICKRCYNKDYMPLWFAKGDNKQRSSKLRSEYSKEYLIKTQKTIEKCVCPICGKPALRLKVEYQNRKTGNKSINEEVYKHRRYRDRTGHYWYHSIPLRET